MFKVGDRVKCVNKFETHEGEEGTVIDVKKDYPNQYLIEYDNYIDGHDGNGLPDVIGKNGYCWWENDSTIKKIKDDNILEIVCKILGVEVGEEWEGNDGKTYVIKDERIIEYYEPENYSDTDYVGWVVSGYEVYADILQGKLKPVKKTALWKPKMNEVYYVPNPIYYVEGERFDRLKWTNTTYDNKALENNLVFKTEEEANEVANRMLEAIKGEGE